MRGFTLYRISSQFSKFYALQDDNHLTDPRYGLLKIWLNKTNQLHSIDWLEGEQINHALIVEFDKYLKSLNQKKDDQH